MYETELSPEKIELLTSIVSLQENQLNACMMIFEGLSDHYDPEVSCVSRVSLMTLKETRDIIEALLERINETIH